MEADPNSYALWSLYREAHADDVDLPDPAYALPCSEFLSDEQDLTTSA